jgi:protein-S-isoprenylcysteine O-methyltransferase Ste14
MALIEEFEKQGNWLFRYRGILPIFILLIGAFLYFRTKLYPDVFYLEQTMYLIYYEVFCLLISLLGFAIRIYTVGHTPRNTSGRNVKGQVADTLNTTGIYSIVRHPLYLGNFFMWLGPALLTGHFWFIIAFIFFYWLYYERIMFAEEQFLRKKFGDVYLAWAEKVPAFIPAPQNFVKPTLAFSWKKVIKKEKTGFAAVFIIFCLFISTGDFIRVQSYNMILIVLTIVSIATYIVIKTLSKYTSLLVEEGR